MLDRASHQEAVARIRFCIAEALLGVITGEVGVGKTVAVRAAISQLDQAAHHIVYLANPTVGTRGLYVTIVQALGAMPRGFKAELVAQTQSLLAAEEHERRRRVVLVIDEAHLLEPGSIRSIRLLTNAEMDSAQSPCSVLLVGQPTLARQLRMGVFAALDQRIATRYQITPMDLANRRSTCVITWLWLVAPIRCLPTTPSPASTRPAWVCRARSTTLPSLR